MTAIKPSHLVVTLICGMTSGLLPAGVQAQQPATLSSRIDEHITAGQLGPVAELCDDATYIRRLSLDFIGRIPTKAELTSFLENPAPQKRAQLVDQLLASEDFNRHMATQLALMLMERRGGKHLKLQEFVSFLEESLRENRSYLEIVTTILSADGSEEQTRAAAAFFLERDMEPNLLTRDVGRIFFGVDLQCAQCHDHPLIDDYLQVNYYGLHAFFVRASLFQPDRKKPALISELATGESNFRSVFTDREGMTGPRLPGGIEVAETTLTADEQYQTAPAKQVRAVPTYSRLKLLAKAISDNPTLEFRRNAANRLWFLMFGRGLIDPVDLTHSDNPSLYPELLEMLAEELVQTKYQIRPILRSLALTQAYQRDFRLPNLQLSTQQARDQITSIQQQAESLKQQLEMEEAKVEPIIANLDEAVSAATPLRQAVADQQKVVAEAHKKQQAAQGKVTTRLQEIKTVTTQLELLKQAVESTTKATEAIKDDKELTSVLTTLQGKTEAITKSIADLEAKRTAEQTVLDQENAALAQAKQTATAAIAALEPADTNVRKIRDQLHSQRAVVTALRSQATLATKNLNLLELLIQRDESEQHVAALSQQIVGINSTLQGLQADIVAQTETIKQQEQLVVAAQKVRDQQQTKYNGLQQQHKAIQGNQIQLNNAITTTQTIAQARPDDQSLADALPLLRASLKQLQTQIAQAEAVLKTEQETLAQAQQALAAIQMQMKSMQDKLQTLKQQAHTTQQQLTAARTGLEEQQANVQSIWQELITSATDRFNLTGIIAMSPEQLALSMLTATGQYDLQRTAIAAKINKEKPLPENADEAALMQREREIEAETYKSLAGTIGTFVRLYGSEAGQPQNEFFATAEQSLFLANGGDLRSWLAPRGGNLTDRLQKLETPSELAAELYLSVLSRAPNAEEVQYVTDYLQSRPEQKPQAVQELAWGLMTSAEFRFCH